MLLRKGSFETAATAGDAQPETGPAVCLEESAPVARIHAGDVDAWEQHICCHETPVQRLAYLILGDSDDAEDVARL